MDRTDEPVTRTSSWGELCILGWSGGGIDALRSAGNHPHVERLVIVSTPFPDILPDDLDLSTIHMNTLLIDGTADPSTGSGHGRRWQQTLPSPRLDMVPGASHDLLPQMWGRLLSHLAPHRKNTRRSPSG